MTKWHFSDGLMYREHPTQTTGVGRNKRPLRYYMTQFSFDGKRYTDAYGWENDFKGGITEIEAFVTQFRANRKAHTPPYSYKEYIANIVEV